MCSQNNKHVLWRLTFWEISMSKTQLFNLSRQIIRLQWSDAFRLVLCYLTSLHDFPNNPKHIAVFLQKLSSTQLSFLGQKGNQCCQQKRRKKGCSRLASHCWTRPDSQLSILPILSDQRTKRRIPLLVLNSVLLTRKKI